MTSSAFMYSSEDSTAKKVDSVPTILLGIDYEWSLIFLWDISASKIQEHVPRSSRIDGNFHAHPRNSLAQLSLRKMRDHL